MATSANWNMTRVDLTFMAPSPGRCLIEEFPDECRDLLAVYYEALSSDSDLSAQARRNLEGARQNQGEGKGVPVNRNE